MKNALCINMLLIPMLLNAQLNVDGKTETNAFQKENNGLRPSTLLFSGSTSAPFGMKYQYCRSFGGYVSLKTDFDLLKNWYHISLGAAKSVGQVVNLYLGGGINFGDYEGKYYSDYYGWRYGPSGGFEGGAILKFNKIAFDIGIGLQREPWQFGTLYSTLQHETSNQLYISYGLGFNF